MLLGGVVSSYERRRIIESTHGHRRSCHRVCAPQWRELLLQLGLVLLLSLFEVPTEANAHNKMLRIKYLRAQNGLPLSAIAL